MITLRFLKWGDHSWLPGRTLNVVTSILLRQAEGDSATDNPSREREKFEGAILAEERERGYGLRNTAFQVRKGKQ